ncbi:uncharacterized protein LOC110047234 [Orbicella faveolata]|uniref:uncharacterized protein LOC110047234 n=1 Tax=Orbicella faveolata TaxID=48498 RepID=UPI0009E38833|nr:uncharacterized protein LOC110047234 [Orbicella faveolata]
MKTYPPASCTTFDQGSILIYLPFQIDNLDSDTNQLSSVLGATRSNLDKLNGTLVTTTLEVQDDLLTLKRSLNSTDENLKSSVGNLQNVIGMLNTTFSDQVQELGQEDNRLQSDLKEVNTTALQQVRYR